MPLIFCVNALLHNSNKLYFSVLQINQLALTLPCSPPPSILPLYSTWTKVLKGTEINSCDVILSRTLSYCTQQLRAGQRQVSPKALMSPLCPQACHTHDAISEASQLMKEAVDDIMVTLNEAASEGGMVGGMVEAIAEAMGRVSPCVRDSISWKVCWDGPTR